jgi:hypothetical protein
MQDAGSREKRPLGQEGTHVGANPVPEIGFDPGQDFPDQLGLFEEVLEFPIRGIEIIFRVNHVLLPRRRFNTKIRTEQRTANEPHPTANCDDMSFSLSFSCRAG